MRNFIFLMLLGIFVGSVVLSSNHNVLAHDEDVILKKLENLEKKIKVLESNSSKMKMLMAPIGSIVGWHKSFANEEIPEGWIECNGQSQGIPNLNENGHFLRGSITSGVMQEQDWKSFSVAGFTHGDYTHSDVHIPKSGYNTIFPFGGKWESPGNLLRFKFDNSEIRPKNMSVVWIMRKK